MAKGFNSSAIPTWLTSSRKEPSYGLPEIGEFLRDELSQKRKDFKPASQNTSSIFPKREMSLNSHFHFYNNNNPNPVKVFCAENEQQTISSQTEALKGNAVSNNAPHCGGIVTADSVFANGADVFHDNLYSTVVSPRSPKGSLVSKKEYFAKSSTTLFDNKVDNPAQKVAKTISQSSDYGHTFAGCHEGEINRPCSFSELLNDDLLSQAVDTLNEPAALPEQVWETNCYNPQTEFVRDQSNGTSGEKYPSAFGCHKQTAAQNHVSVHGLDTFSTDSRFITEQETFESSTHNFPSYIHENITPNPMLRTGEAIKRHADEHDTPFPDWNRSPKVRRKHDIEQSSLDHSIVNEQEESNNHHLCNYLFEDIDLSVVDKSCMEQLEKEYQNEAVKEVEFACSLLNLAKDPCKWDANQVRKWVMWTVHQCRLSSVDVTLFAMSGKEFCSMTENMMRSLAPLCGDILHARLDVWRSVAKLSGSCEKKYCVLDTKTNSTNQVTSGSSSATDKETNGDLVEAMTPNYTSGIHLWQFLKELLLQPDRYGRCIRWIDRDQGVFKIEDSVEVARLWGVRKNRPAMNYDKLSRSIRQYYKKGIIRKTEISQRLVYQFVKKIN